MVRQSLLLTVIHHQKQTAELVKITSPEMCLHKQFHTHLRTMDASEEAGSAH